MPITSQEHYKYDYEGNPYPTRSLQFQNLLIKFSERNSLNNIGGFSCLLGSYPKVISVTKLTVRGTTGSSMQHKAQCFTMKPQHKVMELSKLGKSMKHFLIQLHEALLVASTDGFLKHVAVTTF